jgi:hypothetical protein
MVTVFRWGGEWPLWRPDKNNNNNNNTPSDTTECAQLHVNMCKELGVTLGSELWCENVQKSVETGQVGKVTVLWNQQVQTDRTVPSIKPDIIIRDMKKEHVC